MANLKEKPSMKNENAQRTDTLISALDMLQRTNFTWRMGSGILIRLTDLDGKCLSAEFCLAAEDLENIKPAIIQSLRNTLENRMALQQREIKDIEKILQLKLKLKN